MTVIYTESTRNELLTLDNVVKNQHQCTRWWIKLAFANEQNKIVAYSKSTLKKSRIDSPRTATTEVFGYEVSGSNVNELEKELAKIETLLSNSHDWESLKSVDLSDATELTVTLKEKVVSIVNLLTLHMYRNSRDIDRIAKLLDRYLSALTGVEITHSKDSVLVQMIPTMREGIERFNNLFQERKYTASFTSLENDSESLIGSDRPVLCIAENGYLIDNPYFSSIACYAFPLTRKIAFFIHQIDFDPSSIGWENFNVMQVANSHKLIFSHRDDESLIQKAIDECESQKKDIVKSKLYSIKTVFEDKYPVEIFQYPDSYQLKHNDFTLLAILESYAGYVEKAEEFLRLSGFVVTSEVTKGLKKFVKEIPVGRKDKKTLNELRLWTLEIAKRRGEL